MDINIDVTITTSFYSFCDIAKFVFCPEIGRLVVHNLLYGPKFQSQMLIFAVLNPFTCISRRKNNLKKVNIPL